MKLETINERIQNATATLEKKRGTVTKKLALIEKKKALQAQTADEDAARWIGYEIEHLGEDIESLNRQIAELERKLAAYAIDKTAAEAEPDLPEHLKLMLPEIVATLDENGEAYAAHLKKEYTKMGYSEFYKKYCHADYEWMTAGRESRHKENGRSAEALLRDLYRRVKAVTGEIMSWRGLTLERGTHGYTVINGRIEGENGTAFVESIEAGGYNIQRLHIRVLVKRLG